MNDRTEIDGHREGLTLLNTVRTIGPYEEFVARPVGRADLPEGLVARRPHPDRADGAVLSERLRVLSGRAQIVEHHLTVQCFGILRVSPAQIVQLLEWFPAADLEHLLRAAADGGQLLDPRSALWMGLQMLDAIAHAHGLGMIHGGLSPAHIMVDETGHLRVDFTMARIPQTDDLAATDHIDLRYLHTARGEDGAPPPFHPATDVYGVAAIVFELLTNRMLTDVDGPPWSAHAIRPALPKRLDTVLAAALDPKSGMDARGLQALLTRSFYADLDGDNERDGAPRVAEWLANIRATSDPLLAFRSESPTETPQVPTVMMQGRFTREFLARDLPVQPQDFSPDDDATNPPSGPPSPPVVVGAYRVLEKSTVATPIVVPSQLTHEPGEPTPAASVAPSRSSVPSANFSSPPQPPSPFLWMLLGFTITFVLILVWSASVQPQVGRSSGRVPARMDTAAGQPSH